MSLNSSKFIIPSSFLSNSLIKDSHSSSLKSEFFPPKICFSSLGVIYPLASKSNRSNACLRFFSVSTQFRFEAAATNSEYSIRPFWFRSTFLRIYCSSSSNMIYSPKYSLNPSLSSSNESVPSWFLSNCLNVSKSFSSFYLEFMLFVIYAITACSSFLSQ
jgi:hypothetical protein